MGRTLATTGLLLAALALLACGGNEDEEGTTSDARSGGPRERIATFRKAFEAVDEAGLTGCIDQGTEEGGKLTASVVAAAGAHRDILAIIEARVPAEAREEAVRTFRVCLELGLHEAEESWRRPELWVYREPGGLCPAKPADIEASDALEAHIDKTVFHLLRRDGVWLVSKVQGAWYRDGADYIKAAEWVENNADGLLADPTSADWISELWGKLKAYVNEHYG